MTAFINTAGPIALLATVLFMVWDSQFRHNDDGSRR